MPPAREQATEIVRTLRTRGHTAYFAGGCVRDELLGREPEDYDVATDARPDQITAYFERTSEVGAHFGVVLVRDRSSATEVATFRSDGAYSDSRRPDSVEFTDAEGDAQRRDFTINALFLDPLAEAEDVRERVIDYVGGVADLDAGVVRAVGDAEQRLAEDHLRALRAVRFAARFGFRIDDDTQEAVRAHAAELAGVSRERVGDDVRRMMNDGASRAHAAWTLQYLGLDAPVFGAHVDRVPRVLGRLGVGAPFATCLAAWAIDRGEVVELSQVVGLAGSWRSRLCLSNTERDGLAGALTGLGRLEREWQSWGVAAQKRAAAGVWFEESMRLLAAKDREEFVRRRRRVLELEQSPGGISPDPLVNGDDLIQNGMSAGPDLGRVLEAVYDAQLEGRVSTREEAMELARSLGV